MVPESKEEFKKWYEEGRALRICLSTEAKINLAKTVRINFSQQPTIDKLEDKSIEIIQLEDKKKKNEENLKRSRDL